MNGFSRPRIAVVGSVNLDLVARVRAAAAAGGDRQRRDLRPRPGREGRQPGRRRRPARRGRALRRAPSAVDDFADEALAGLERRASTRTASSWISEPDVHTGVALILVDDDGENEIVVAPGANAYLAPERRRRDADAVHLPARDPRRGRPRGARAGAASSASTPLPPRAVRRRARPARRQPLEHEVDGRPRQARRASRSAPRARCCSRTGRRSRAPSRRPVDAVDGTAAGDAFTACLVVSLARGPRADEALRRACAAGALAASRPGAQPSLPTAAEIDAILGMTTPILIDCDPGHDDAIALLLALASPEVELLGVTTVARQPDAREDDRERAQGPRVRRPRRSPGRGGRRRGRSCASRYVAAYVHGETRPRRPRPAAAARRSRSPSTPSTSSRERSSSASR